MSNKSKKRPQRPQQPRPTPLEPGPSPEAEEPQGTEVKVEKFIEVLQNKLAQERQRNDLMEAIIMQKDEEIAQLRKTQDQLSERFNDAQVSGDPEPSAASAG